MAGVTLDFSKAQPVQQQQQQQPVSLDFSKAQPLVDGQAVTQTQRPSSSSQFETARQEGVYTESSERSGKPVAYLMQKPGENYLDFMKRAAAHGKTVSQEQIKDEALQPKKAARSLARGAELGVAGAAGIVGAGEAGGAISEKIASQIPRDLFGNPQIAKAIADAAKSHPIVSKLIMKGLEGIALAAGGKTAYDFLKK